MLLLSKFLESDTYILEKLILIEPHSSFFQFFWRKISCQISQETLPKIIALFSRKEDILYGHNFVKSFPLQYMKSYLDDGLIPIKYGGTSQMFRHVVCNYSFEDSDLSTFDNSSSQRPNVFVTSSFTYDVQQIDKLKKKVAFVESNVEEIVKL